MASGNNPLHKKIRDLTAENSDLKNRLQYETEVAAGWKNLHHSVETTVSNLHDKVADLQASMSVRALVFFGLGTGFGALLYAVATS